MTCIFVIENITFTSSNVSFTIPFMNDVTYHPLKRIHYWLMHNKKKGIYFRIIYMLISKCSSNAQIISQN